MVDCNGNGGKEAGHKSDREFLAKSTPHEGVGRVQREGKRALRTKQE